MLIESPLAAAAAGWLGLTRQTVELDWRLLASLPDGAIPVFVERRSPAWRAGVRSGDVVISANDLSLEAFEAMMLPIGAPVVLRIMRREARHHVAMTIFATIGRRPTPRKQAAWRAREPVACGEEVAAKQRPAFVAAMSCHPHVAPLAFKILMRLMSYYDGRRGAWPSYATLARDCRCSRRSVIDHVEQLKALGVLDVVRNGGAGRNDRKTNRYRVTWPATNVVRISRRRGEAGCTNEVQKTTRTR